MHHVHYLFFYSKIKGSVTGLAVRTMLTLTYICHWILAFIYKSECFFKRYCTYENKVFLDFTQGHFF